jgi:hypothetical protein
MAWEWEVPLTLVYMRPTKMFGNSAGGIGHPVDDLPLHLGLIHSCTMSPNLPNLTQNGAARSTL